MDYGDGQNEGFSYSTTLTFNITGICGPEGEANNGKAHGNSCSLSAVVAAGIVSVVTSDGAKGEAEQRGGNARYEFVPRDSSDLKSMEKWAEGICGGATVAQMAAFFSVPPTEAAVLERIEQGLPKRTGAVVRKVCADSMRAAQDREKA